jgi:hypothetical protein
MLEKCVIKFRAANPTRREKMVQDAAETIQRTRMVDVEFNRVALINVCELSARLGYSHIFLVH